MEFWLISAHSVTIEVTPLGGSNNPLEIESFDDHM
jgi:hypothetical protein